MDRMGWIALAGAGVVGIGLAAVLLVAWPPPDEAPGPELGETATLETRAPDTHPEPVVPPRTRPEPGATTPAAALPPRGEDGVDPRLALLLAEGDALLARTFSLEDLPKGDPRALDRARAEQLRSFHADVEAAVVEHLRYASIAPRPEAEQAVERAAVLREHLASELRGAEIPEHLPPAEARVTRTMLDRMAENHQRQAKALRAGGIPEGPPPALPEGGQVGAVQGR